jgi:hypothetical protein
MNISPRITSVPAITQQAHAEAGENNIIALIPSKPTEPTLLEITEPDVSFEELSS